MENNKEVLEEQILENTSEEISEVVEKEQSMEDFAQDIDKNLKRLYIEDIVSGKVIAKVNNDIIMDIGYHAEGIVKSEELSTNPNFNFENDIQVGDEFDVMILKLDDGNGNVILSKIKADAITVWDRIKEYAEKETNLTVKPSQVVKGGIVSYFEGLRAFTPASLISADYVKNMEEYIGKDLKVRVVEYDIDKKKVILSGKEIDQERKEAEKQQVLTSLVKGQQVDGVVKKLMNFGAFVDIGGIDGLVRNQDLAWKRVKHPSEIVKEGDKVKVTILDVNMNTGKIALGLKDINEDPWVLAAEKFSVGQIVKGEVVRLVDFGAFVKIEQGVEGLVHISEISEDRVNNPKDVLEIGDTVEVKIKEFSSKSKKMALSIKEAKEDMDRSALGDFNDDSEATTNLKDVFGDILNQLNN